MSRTLEIRSFGAKGDGVADGPVFVPFTLPGESVVVEGEGQHVHVTQIRQASPDRVVPPCPHFGRCGGCDLQHAGDNLYREFKRDRVIEALRREGLEAPVEPLVTCAPRSRRRVVLTAIRAAGGIEFGFHEAASHRVAPIETCFVAVPAIVDALPALKRLASIIADEKRELRLTVTATASGLDVLAEAVGRVDERKRQAAMRHAIEANFARLSLGSEILVESRSPSVEIAGIPVSFPPGAFLQAVASAEEEMARRVESHLGKAKAVADLFSGLGTFALRLAKAHAVHAVETDAPALAVLERARRNASGLKPVTTERRDLFRRPITFKELARYGGLVFDPPRAGAEAQCHEIAKSGVRLVAAVSCNPTTFARDAAILTKGGYRLSSVTPIDQFLWSHHVEMVGLFER